MAVHHNLHQVILLKFEMSIICDYYLFYHTNFFILANCNRSPQATPSKYPLYKNEIYSRYLLICLLVVLEAY